MNENNDNIDPFHLPAPRQRIPGSRRKRENIAQQIKKANEERGIMTEKKFFDVFLRYLQGKERQQLLPWWFYGVERATPHHDKKGADAFVLTDIGKIPVQIKSSMAGAKQFLNKQCHEGIVIIVIHKGISDGRILSKTRSFVSKFRQEVMSGSRKCKEFE